MTERLAVVVPARDERQLIDACLRSVLTALDHAPGDHRVVVVAHRCEDDTAAAARHVLGGRGTVLELADGHVSHARAHGAEHALDGLGDHDWLLSTDADTTVPPDWAARLLAHGRAGADAVAGLATLAHPLPGEAGRRYDRLVAAGVDGDSHEHAYAANLAVRAGAYRDAGGWPTAVVNGEEHALLAALGHRGWAVRRPTDVVVVTSSRRRARAVGGLGDLLQSLEAS